MRNPIAATAAFYTQVMASDVPGRVDVFVWPSDHAGLAATITQPSAMR